MKLVDARKTSAVISTTRETAFSDTTHPSFSQVNNPHCSRSQCKSIRRQEARLVPATIQIRHQAHSNFPKEFTEKVGAVKKSTNFGPIIIID